MNLYVGNLSFKTSEEELTRTFEQYGSVESARLITDKATGRPRGFGFVEMSDEGEAQEAIEQLNDKEIDGRRLVVNEARAKSSR